MNTVKINRAEYPLRLGMLAMRRISKDYGGLGKLIECLESDDLDVQDKALYDLAYALIENGIKADEIAKGEEAQFRPVLKSPEHISVMLNPLEYADLFRTVSKTITEETQTTVQAETPEGASKNALTTPEK